MRRQARLLFGESLRNRAAVISRPAAPMRHLVAPGQRLAVALLQRGEGPARPERIADIADGALHAPFPISRPRLARARYEVIVGAQLQQPRIKVDLVAAAFQYGTFEVVIENHRRLAAPRLKGIDMAAQEILSRLAEEELKVQRPRVGQRDRKAGQLAAGAAGRDAPQCAQSACACSAGKVCRRRGTLRARADAVGRRCQCNRAQCAFKFLRRWIIW